MKIIGIDPGLGATGWGVIEINGNILRGIAFGTISPSAKLDIAQRLDQIYSGLCDVIKDHAPLEAAVEESFMGNNAASALKLGMARGIAILAPSQSGIPVMEYSARLVKKSITGTGSADKNQISLMVGRLLPQCKTATSHEADALAIAICHAHHRGSAAMAKKFS